jgi:hypothetical protein
VIYTLLLRSLNRYGIAYALYKLNRHFIVRTLILIALAIHVPLQFAKPSSLTLMQTYGVEVSVIIVEGICIALELFQVVSSIIVLVKLIQSHNVTLEVQNELEELGSSETDEEDYAQTLAEVLKLKFRNKLKTNSFLLFLDTIVAVDWFLIIFKRFSLEYYFPIRVIIVVMTNNSVR